MVKGWEKKIAKAQLQTEVAFSKRKGARGYKRTRYGDEDSPWNFDGRDCPDCAVKPGQFHVMGCDIERCPKCKRQLISCDCEE